MAHQAAVALKGCSGPAEAKLAQTAPVSSLVLGNDVGSAPVASTSAIPATIAPGTAVDSPAQTSLLQESGKTSSKRIRAAGELVDLTLRADKLVKLEENVANLKPQPKLASIFTKASSNTLSSGPSLKGKETAVALEDTPSKPRFTWLKSDTSVLLHGFFGNPPLNTKLACFDIDGTLIQTKSRARFPKGETDWTWWCPDGKVESRLREYHQAGYAIIFVSNQNYAPHTKAHQYFKAKLPLIAATLGDVPFRVFAAIAKDNYYRKPDIGIWLLLDEMARRDGLVLDKSASFYVGDAAGRPAFPKCANKKPGTQPDHSSCDRDWAANAGIAFFTPEEFFWERRDLAVPALQTVNANHGNAARIPTTG